VVGHPGRYGDVDTALDICHALTMNDREPVLEYACHEGNYGLRNILSAARAEERNHER
jgi:hypothetical protein